MNNSQKDNFDQFDRLTDQEIMQIINQGNTDAVDYMINKYKSVVKLKARSYFLIGAENEDIIQEGMIGLFKAIRDYKNDKQVSFKVFAELCIQRQMITAVKTATRKKHTPLNTYISFSKQLSDEDSERTVLDMIGASSNLNPEEMLIGRERLTDIANKLNESLSSLEKEVLSLYLSGMSYQEIAARLNKSIKCIDNALQRIKKKLDRYLASRN